ALAAGAKPAEVIPPVTVTQNPVSPGRVRRSLLTPSRGEGRVAPVEPVVNTLVCFPTCARGCGCSQRPAFPAPSICWRDLLKQRLGCFCAARTRGRAVAAPDRLFRRAPAFKILLKMVAGAQRSLRNRNSRGTFGRRTGAPMHAPLFCHTPA